MARCQCRSTRPRGGTSPCAISAIAPGLSIAVRSAAQIAVLHRRSNSAPPVARRAHIACRRSCRSRLVSRSSCRCEAKQNANAASAKVNYAGLYQPAFAVSCRGEELNPNAQCDAGHGGTYNGTVWIGSPVKAFMGMYVMTSSVTGQTETDIFTLDVSDDALERAAAVADGQRITVGFCTHWYSCNWPLSPAERAASRQS